MKLPSILLALPLTALAAEPTLTVYNQNFAVVRESISMDLKDGLNEVKFSDITAHLEPDSVILRDPSGQVQLQIREQNFRNDPVSQQMMLSLFEGQEIDFVVRESQKPDRIVRGKIIRSGYVPHDNAAMQRYGNAYATAQMGMASQTANPIIEVDGKLQFQLPGLPIFPALADQTILKPELSWQLNASKAAKLDVELCYVSGGMSWSADYNLVASKNSDELDLIGWVTIDNQSGKTFENARLKLMAGDVSKIQPGENFAALGRASLKMDTASGMAPTVSEKSFDEYHLYTLKDKTTLRDRQTKQVEFVRASGIKSERIYVYDGLYLDPQRWNGWNRQNLRNNEEFGQDSQKKVAVMREFKNSEANNLGMPLPAGRLRFYQQDDDRQLEFTGENTIDHTPKNETVRVYTGNAFDLIGERRRTNFKVDSSNKWVDESFEITLRNHKKEAVEIRVVEHLYRWVNWEITEKSTPFTKTNAQEIEFRVALKPDEEKTITYTVHYSW